MKSAVLLILLVIIVAVSAGIIVIHRQGTHPCVRYYTKDGSRELSKVCK
jgi:hypothetical protein